MNKQWFVAVPVFIVIALAGTYLVSGGDMPGDWPGEEYRAEVSVRTSRGLIGSASIHIREVNVDRGYTLSFGPLLFSCDYQLQVSAYRGNTLLDRKTVGVTVEWYSETDTVVGWLGLGSQRDARIVARLYYNGALEAEAETTT